MKDEYIAIIVFIIAFVIFVYVIGGMMHNDAIQESMLICMNSAMHTNRSLPVEEAARICGGFVK
jgi:hypothetical protein